jgi:hypothetical protein
LEQSHPICTFLQSKAPWGPYGPLGVKGSACLMIFLWNTQILQIWLNVISNTMVAIVNVLIKVNQNPSPCAPKTNIYKIHSTLLEQIMLHPGYQ